MRAPGSIPFGGIVEPISKRESDDFEASERSGQVLDIYSVHYYAVGMSKSIGATEFKQKCLAILDRVGPDGIVITKHGKPVARLVPVEKASAELIGSLSDKIQVHGDILSTGIRWDAES